MSNSGWMRTEYNYDTPAVCMRIDGKDWMKHFDTDKIFQSDDPEEIAKCAHSFIESKYPFLSGCVVFYVRYDVWQRMLEIGVSSERFKRVPMGQTFPKVRVPSSDNSGLQPGLDECRIEDVLRNGEWMSGEIDTNVCAIATEIFDFNLPQDCVIDKEKLQQQMEHWFNTAKLLPIDKSVLRPYLDNAPNSSMKTNSPTTDNGMKVASDYTPGSLSILPESVQHRNDNETDSGADEPTIVLHTD